MKFVSTYPQSNQSPVIRWIDVLLPILVLGIYVTMRTSVPRENEGPADWMKGARDAIERKDFKAAKALNHKLLGVFPKNHIYLEQGAQIAYALGQSLEEAELLAKFILHAPDPGEACPRFPEAYRKVGDLAKMVQAAETCVALEPRNSDFRLELALSLERSGDTERALQFFTDGKKDYPGYTDFAIGRARLLLRTGDVPTAWSEISEILKADAHLADAQLVGGLAAMRLNNWKAALEILEQGVVDHPTYDEMKDALTRARTQGEQQ